MKIEPLFDRVIATCIRQFNKTESGISLELYDDGEIKKGIVVAVGPGGYDEGVFVNMQVNLGDIIYFEDHVTSKIIYDNKPYILIKQTDILAVERKEEII